MLASKWIFHLIFTPFLRGSAACFIYHTSWDGTFQKQNSWYTKSHTRSDFMDILHKITFIGFSKLWNSYFTKMFIKMLDGRRLSLVIPCQNALMTEKYKVFLRIPVCLFLYPQFLKGKKLFGAKKRKLF